MMPIVWTESQTLKLVILYSRYECLRNPFHRDFKNKLCRYKAYKQIVDSMNICGLTVADCIKKITYLKAQYCYELSNISASISCEKSYKPKAIWFPIMHEILFPFVKTCGYLDNYWKVYNDEKSTFDNYCHNETGDQLVYSNDVEIKKTPNKDCRCTYANCCCESYKTKSYTRSKKPWTKAQVDELTDSIATNHLHLCSQNARVDAGSNIGKSITEEHETQTDESCFKNNCVTCPVHVEDNTAAKSDTKDAATDDIKEKKTVHDEFDMFGKSIASQLRNINFEVAIKLEKCIQDLITQERLDDIKSKSASHTGRSDCCSSSCSDCKVMRKEMICSCGLPVIMIKTDQSCEFNCK